MIFFPVTVDSLSLTPSGQFVPHCLSRCCSARSTVVTRFDATMMTLTSVCRLSTFLRKQISCVNGTILA